MNTAPQAADLRREHRDPQCGMIDRVDSLPDISPRVAFRPENPGPAARQIFGHTSMLTKDNSALTCEDADSWTHACLSAITRFCSSTAHFRVQATGQLRNPGYGEGHSSGATVAVTGWQGPAGGDCYEACRTARRAACPWMMSRRCRTPTRRSTGVTSRLHRGDDLRH